MDGISLPGPSDISRVWWNEVCKKLKKAVIFLDDFIAESLHWSGGTERLFEAGATDIKQLSSFEKCNDDDTKAVFLLSSPMQEISKDIIRDIVSAAKLSYVVVISGAHPSIHTFCKYGVQDENEATMMNELESELLVWMGNMNFTAEIFYYPLFVVPVTQSFFVVPKFSHVYPIMESDMKTLNKHHQRFRKAEQHSSESLSDIGFGHLPRNFQISIRHLVSFFHSLFQGMNVREEIFSLGTTSKIIASELESHAPSKQRRKLAPTKASLVLVDRTLDLASAASNDANSLLNRIMSLLPRLPGHHVDSAVYMAPLSKVHSSCEWTLLPGCLSLSQESDSKDLFQKMVHSNKSSFMGALREKVSVISRKEDKGNNPSLLESIKQLASEPEKLIANFGVIQQCLAVSECLTHPRYQFLDKIHTFEKKILQCIYDSEEMSPLDEIVHLLTNRKTHSMSIDDILSLAVYSASLGADRVVEESIEYRFTNSLSQSILEDQDILSNELKTIIGEEVTEVSAFKAASNIWERLHSISNCRLALKDYQNLISREDEKEPFTYKNLLQSLINDCLSTPQVQMNDLECRSAGFKNIIKSGFSLFVNVSKPMPRDAAMMIIYVIGGLSANEILDLSELIEQSNPSCQVFIASSHITYPSDAICKALSPNPLLDYY